jgi:retinol dehydrogenase 12
MLKSADGMDSVRQYGQSKLANILWTRQLAKQHPLVTVAAVHPGQVQTNLATGATGMPKIVRLFWPLFALTLTLVDKGARNQLWALVSKDVQSSEYYEPVGVEGQATTLGKDDKLAKKVWDWTETELSRHGD